MQKRNVTRSFASFALTTSLIVFAACKAEETTTVDTSTDTSTDTAASLTDTSMTTMSSTDTMTTSTATATGTAPATSMTAQDHEFTTKAAVGGMAEVQLGQLAQQKGQSADVKSFAQKMVQDHTQANTELTQLASSKGMAPPADLDEEHKAVMNKLQPLSGAEFDKEYMKAMVADHHKTVALFEKQSNEGTDPDLKGFAAKTLPKLKEHHDLASSVAKKVGAQ